MLPTLFHFLSDMSKKINANLFESNHIPAVKGQNIVPIMPV